MSLFSKSTFKPMKVLEEDYVGPQWLEELELSRSGVKKVEVLLKDFNTARNFFDKPLLTLSDVDPFEPLPAKFDALLRLAVEDPFKFISSQPHGTNDVTISLMTRLDFVRAIIYYSHFIAEHESSSNRYGGYPGLYSNSIVAENSFANLRGTYLVSLLQEVLAFNSYYDQTQLYLMRELQGGNFDSGHSSRYFDEVLKQKNLVDQANLAEKVFSRPLKADKEGLYLFFGSETKVKFPEGQPQVPYLPEDVILEGYLKERSELCSEHYQLGANFMIFDADALVGVSPATIFRRRAFVFVETTNVKFSAELLILNIEKSYPTETLPGHAAPSFEEFFKYPQRQQVYMDIAIERAKEAHDSLLS